MTLYSQRSIPTTTYTGRTPVSTSYTSRPVYNPFTYSDLGTQTYADLGTLTYAELFSGQPLTVYSVRTPI